MPASYTSKELSDFNQKNRTFISDQVEIKVWIQHPEHL